MNKFNWPLDGSSIPFEIYDFIKSQNVSNLLELGSGKGTEFLSKITSVTSIEHNPKYIGLYNSEYIYAPLKKTNYPDFPEENYWYDPDIIQSKLKNIDYSFILVDGPIGGINGGRSGFYYNYNLFKKVPFIIDDLHRPAEKRMFDFFIKELKCSNKIIPYKFQSTLCSFGYINPFE